MKQKVHIDSGERAFCVKPKSGDLAHLALNPCASKRHGWRGILSEAFMLTPVCVTIRGGPPAAIGCKDKGAILLCKATYADQTLDRIMLLVANWSQLQCCFPQHLRLERQGLCCWPQKRPAILPSIFLQLATFYLSSPQQPLQKC